MKKQIKHRKNSQTWKLINQYGLNSIKKTWQEYGMYQTARQLGCSPYIIRHIAQKIIEKDRLQRHRQS